MNTSLPPAQLARILAQTDETAPPAPGGRAQVLLGEQRARIVGIDLSWGETFLLCLKVAICAIPAIWIAVIAYKIPEAIIAGLTVAAATQR